MAVDLWRLFSPPPSQLSCVRRSTLELKWIVRGFITRQVLFSPAANSLFIVTLGCTDWWCKLLAARKMLLAMISSPVVMSTCYLPLYDWRCWSCTKAHLRKWTRYRKSANQLTQGVLLSCVVINVPKIWAPEGCYEDSVVLRAHM